MRDDGPVTGEEILKGLAEERQPEVERAAPEHRHSMMLEARPFLTGAFIALARANAFAVRPTLHYREELLAPVEQPHVDQGVVERISFTFGASTSGAIIREDESER